MRKWLVQIRTSLGKSQEQIAKDIGISQSYYAAIEIGVRGKNISGRMAKKIASTMGFDWQKFYEEDEHEKTA